MCLAPRLKAQWTGTPEVFQTNWKCIAYLVDCQSDIESSSGRFDAQNFELWRWSRERTGGWVPGYGPLGLTRHRVKGVFRWSIIAGFGTNTSRYYIYTNLE